MRRITYATSTKSSAWAFDAAAAPRLSYGTARRVPRTSFGTRGVNSGDGS
jgi:hypothetical protein